MAAVTIGPMALTIGDRPVRKLTVDEVDRMLEHGILEDSRRVELLHGVLVERVSEGEPHALVTERILRWVAPLLVRDAYRVQMGSPLRLPDNTSLPEPDAKVFTRDAPELARVSTALLVIEVSVTSLRTDLRVKAPMYASADVVEYWVIDVNGREVVIHTEPRANDYDSIRRVSGGPLQPIAVDVEPLDLDALFAGLHSG